MAKEMTIEPLLQRFQLGQHPIAHPLPTLHPRHQRPRLLDPTFPQCPAAIEEIHRSQRPPRNGLKRGPETGWQPINRAIEGISPRTSRGNQGPSLGIEGI